MLKWDAYAEEKAKSGTPTVAIVGGGVAGLTAAYRLQAAGIKPILFEASNRWGGRMLTVYDFYKGMFAELGGEFVDTNHEDLITLAGELGLEMQSLAVEGEDLYYFGGKFYTPSDMVDPEKQSGAFAPIAEKIAEDADQLYTEDEDWTDFAYELDKMSLKDYLEQFRGKAEDWAIDLLDVAYVGEFGLETEDQSCLNLVDFIGTDLNEPFAIFGDSDEAYRIKGGSSTMIKALEAALKDKADMRLGHALTEIGTKDGQVVLTFNAPGGTKSESFDHVIFTLPFTKLREVKGLESLELDELKMQAINELGYGTNAKVYNGTTSRPWRSKDLSGLPAVSNGAFYSDLAFQDIWEMSRAQPGEGGILTNYLGGKAGTGDENAALDAFRSGVAKMAPKVAESFDKAATASFFWDRYPYTLGSYASAKPGQYTTLLDVAAEPALDGRVQFAGEHTSVDFLGYMNGGVESGNRASAALIEIMAPEKAETP
ncbi:MAG: flavin monoamine oxidase family protein [Methyloceanibacter sp.]|uniref:flavin monoamine oxidase family protein n=1 Tax=Methyloceanibacter sp. TaxID=1965321 RepID=UPI003D6D7E64